MDRIAGVKMGQDSDLRLNCRITLSPCHCLWVTVLLPSKCTITCERIRLFYLLWRPVGSGL